MPMKLEVKRMETTCDVVVKALGGNHIEYVDCFD